MSRTTTLFASAIMAAVAALSTAACSANATGNTAAQTSAQTNAQPGTQPGTLPGTLPETQPETQPDVLGDVQPDVQPDVQQDAQQDAPTDAQGVTLAAGKNVGTGKGAACRKVVITGVRVGVREFAFTNADVLRVRDTGSTLTSCGTLRGNGSNGYADKCGRSGYNWYKVTIPATRNWAGQTVTEGFVPVTCARVR
ncbi:hypothetical protein [Nonomuraea sp. NPDC003214]